MHVDDWIWWKMVEYTRNMVKYSGIWIKWWLSMNGKIWLNMNSILLNWLHIRWPQIKLNPYFHGNRFKLTSRYWDVTDLDILYIYILYILYYILYIYIYSVGESSWIISKNGIFYAFSWSNFNQSSRGPHHIPQGRIIPTVPSGEDPITSFVSKVLKNFMSSRSRNFQVGGFNPS